MALQQSRPDQARARGAWGLRNPSLIMGKDGKHEVKEFTRMWREHPQATADPIARCVRTSPEHSALRRAPLF